MEDCEQLDNEYQQIVITNGQTTVVSDSEPESKDTKELELEKKYYFASNLLVDMKLESKNMYDPIFENLDVDDILHFTK